MTPTRPMLVLTLQLAAGAAVVVAVASAVSGQPVSLGFFGGLAVVLGQLLLLAFTVQKINVVLAYGGHPGAAGMALNMRFLLMVVALWALASTTSILPVFFGMLLGFTSLVIAAFLTTPRHLSLEAA